MLHTLEMYEFAGGSAVVSSLYPPPPGLATTAASQGRGARHTDLLSAPGIEQTFRHLMGFILRTASLFLRRFFLVVYWQNDLDCA